MTCIKEEKILDCGVTIGMVAASGIIALLQGDWWIGAPVTIFAAWLWGHFGRKVRKRYGG